MSWSPWWRCRVTEHPGHTYLIKSQSLRWLGGRCKSKRCSFSRAQQTAPVWIRPAEMPKPIPAPVSALGEGNTALFNGCIRSFWKVNNINDPRKRVVTGVGPSATPLAVKCCFILALTRHFCPASCAGLAVFCYFWTFREHLQCSPLFVFSNVKVTPLWASRPQGHTPLDSAWKNKTYQCNHMSLRAMIFGGSFLFFLSPLIYFDS